ncbi:urease accessory protein UreD [Neptunomonas antarctica]|uniref:Urease accessory protein UreD n=1 Tax=Neptunomonas antarctica TaxID=619304 RepID=A0A1N7J476_9GAMM|nr:urease accessory protein UreD [Neptunomonas antarctica]SIS44158.1 urease accessory protein [Neptunomonas antarctica]
MNAPVSNPSVQNQQAENQPPSGTGWKAQLQLGYRFRQDKTRLVERLQRGPLAVQRSLYPEGSPCHTYILHPPGGVVGGDQLDIRVRTHSGSHALLTTPGATKYYRSDEKMAYQQQTLTVEKDSILEWFPQENICFPGAHAQIHSDIYLEQGSRFIGWELQCLGRPAIQEAFTHGSIDARTRVYIDGEITLIDRMSTQGNGLINSAAGLRGYAMNATLIAGVIDADSLELVRSILETFDPQLPVGATWVDNLLVVRMLGNNTEDIQKVLIPVWKALRQHWLKIPACSPRIWAT